MGRRPGPGDTPTHSPHAKKSVTIPGVARCQELPAALCLTGEEKCYDGTARNWVAVPSTQLRARVPIQSVAEWRPWRPWEAAAPRTKANGAGHLRTCGSARPSLQLGPGRGQKLPLAVSVVVSAPCA